MNTIENCKYYNTSIEGKKIKGFKLHEGKMAEIKKCIQEYSRIMNDCSFVCGVYAVTECGKEMFVCDSIVSLSGNIRCHNEDIIYGYDFDLELLDNIMVENQDYLDLSKY